MHTMSSFKQKENQKLGIKAVYSFINGAQINTEFIAADLRGLRKILLFVVNCVRSLCVSVSNYAAMFLFADAGIIIFVRFCRALEIFMSVD